jgi:uncharacterized protein YndB with AHSA1/START domain
MTTSKNNPVKETAEMKIVITRIFDAPRKLVYETWTKPEHLKKWSAPHGFTIPVSEGDLRVGGTWRACMIAPDGNKLWLSGVYREVVENELLVFTHAWENENGEPGPETLVTVRFADHGRKTQLTFEQSGFASTESRDGHEGGWSQFFERLAEHLNELRNS